MKPHFLVTHRAGFVSAQIVKERQELQIKTDVVNKYRGRRICDCCAAFCMELSVPWRPAAAKTTPSVAARRRPKTPGLVLAR